jgi:aminobenzoyl-glutamate utilization protein A
MEILKGSAQMHDVRLKIEGSGEYVSSTNSPELIQLLKKSALESGLKEHAIIDTFSSSGCEDATFLMNEVIRNGGKASFVCIGSPTYGGHHNSEFDFDEDMMVWAVNMLWEFTKSL